jgi:peptidoglycan hydrolase CwlO-like protein
MTNQDRNYLSMLSDSELVRTALDRNHELAVVLAERLSELLDVQEQLDDAKKEIEDLDKHWTKWMEEANALRAELDALRGAS